MPATTGQTIIGDAFNLLNVFLPGQLVPNSDAQLALRFLNDLLDEYSQQAQMIPVIAPFVFPLVAGQGGRENPYTIGPSGNFNTVRPSNQNSIVAANLVLTASSPNVRVPLAILTDDAYDAEAIPDLTNSQPTAIYYNPTYANDLGSISLWPIPNTSVNPLELFIQQGVPNFADLTTTYYLPEGWAKALKYNLADELQTPYGRTLSPAAQRIALRSLGTIKRSNVKLSDLMNDAAWTSNRRTLYNILSGQGSGA